MDSGMSSTRAFLRRHVPGWVAPWQRRSVLASLALLLSSRLLAEGPDDRFIDVYNVIQQADQSQDKRAARQMYEQAQARLRALQRDYPTWNERVVSYRLRYTADKLKALPALAPEPASPLTPGVPPPAAVADSGEVITQFNQLSLQIRMLQSDKQLLEAKLREALTAQPAPVDPREFQAAIERIATLQQTNKNLISTLQQQQAERANLVDKVLLDETQRALTEANQALSGQRDKAGQMERERAAAVAELKRLQNDSLRSLSLENSILKLQVTKLKSETPNGRQVAELTAQMARLEAGLTDLQQQNAALTADKALLEKQLEDLKAKSAEESIVKLAQLESQLAVATAESARQSARVEDIAARLAQERQARTELQSENTNLAKRVADLTASSEDDTQIKKQLQEALAAEKSEHAQVEAELKAAEMKLAMLQAAAANSVRPSVNPAADAAAEAAGASLLFETQVKGLRAEVDTLRDTVQSSAQRETELTSALSLETSLRQRLEREKGEIEKRLAAANVQLAANRVESARNVAPATATSPGGIRPAAELETRVRQLEQERQELRARLAQLTQNAPLALAAARIRRATSPRDRASDFLQYRQLKAFAAEPATPTAEFSPPPPLRSSRR